MNASAYRKRAASILREVYREFTFMGGYPMAARMADGELLCTQCALAHARLIMRADVRGDSWQVAGAEVLWEGPAEPCSHCNRPLETAYGDPEGGAS